MTGSNRLLLGLGWPLVAVIAWLARRRPRLSLSRDAVMPLFFLGIATIYSFLLPLKAQIGLLDSGLLFALFGVYAVLALREPTIEPDLVGPAATLGALPKTTRRLAILGLFGFASFAIVESAGPFAEGLVRTGQALGIDEFLLVQWLAPLASEAPEFLVAALLSVRGKGSAALALLLSSKLNQWTLLVGSLPLAYVVGAVVDGLPVSSIPMHALPLDGRQAAEIWLTAAQSLFGVAVLASLSLELSEAVLLAVLFSAQLIVGGFLRTSLHNPAAANEELFVFTLGYLILSLIFGIQARKTITSLRRRGRRKHLNYPAVQE